ncbi:hypothetical protein [Dactylosporangium sp. NPDC051484]|uniref:hypothetical protein n=1 Tax=Dactylosporangium sp. NPDC051484 TaxID=3154942 RepID=UPI00344DD8D4
MTERKFIHEPDRLRGFMEAAAERGLTASATVVGPVRRAATVDEAQALSLGDGDAVVQPERMRGL